MTQQPNVGSSTLVGDNSIYSSQPTPVFDPHYGGNMSSEPPDSQTSQALLPVPYSQTQTHQAVPLVPSHSHTREAVPSVPSGLTSEYSDPSSSKPPLNTSQHSTGYNPYAKPAGQPFVQNYAQSRSDSNVSPTSTRPKAPELYPTHSSPNKSAPMNTSSHMLSDAGSPISEVGQLPNIPENTGGTHNEVIVAEELTICIGSQNL